MESQAWLMLECMTSNKQLHAAGSRADGAVSGTFPSDSALGQHEARGHRAVIWLKCNPKSLATCGSKSAHPSFCNRD